MNTDFIFSKTDTRPMYLQIMEQINRRIAVGDWPVGAKIPSIRELAVAAKVSVITVKRAYLELERNGVINTRQGRGSWVNGDLDVSGLRQSELVQHFERAVEIGESMSLGREDLLSMLLKVIDKER